MVHKHPAHAQKESPDKDIPIWIDTHCHLDMTKPEPDTVIKQSALLNTPIMVTIGTTHDSNIFIDGLTQTNPCVYGTLGYHPHHADQFAEAHLEFIQTAMATNPKIVGIGECGYDFHYNFSDADNQRRVFERFLRFALETNYPLVVHTREAESMTMKTMEPFLKKGLRAVLHSFTSSTELARFGIKYDCYFSFNGISTYKKSTQIREIFKMVPLNRIMLETDSPYLSPEPYRGKQNIPGYVGRIGHYLAEFGQMDAFEFSAMVNENARRFYRRFSPDTDGVQMMRATAVT